MASISLDFVLVQLTRQWARRSAFVSENKFRTFSFGFSVWFNGQLQSEVTSLCQNGFCLRPWNEWLSHQPARERFAFDRFSSPNKKCEAPSILGSIGVNSWKLIWSENVNSVVKIELTALRIIQKFHQNRFCILIRSFVFSASMNIFGKKDSIFGWICFTNSKLFSKCKIFSSKIKQRLMWILVHLFLLGYAPLT